MTIGHVGLHKGCGLAQGPCLVEVVGKRGAALQRVQMAVDQRACGPHRTTGRVSIMHTKSKSPTRPHTHALPLRCAASLNHPRARLAMKLCVVKPQAATTAAPTASRPTAASATFMAGCERAKERERERRKEKTEREANEIDPRGNISQFILL